MLTEDEMVEIIDVRNFKKTGRRLTAAELEVVRDTYRQCKHLLGRGETGTTPRTKFNEYFVSYPGVDGRRERKPVSSFRAALDEAYRLERERPETIGRVEVVEYRRGIPFTYHLSDF